MVSLATIALHCIAALAVGRAMVGRSTGTTTITTVTTRPVRPVVFA